MISGNEVLTITYNDRTIELVASGMLDMVNQFMDYADYAYTIYDDDDSDNFIDNPKFINRKDSYWLSDICGDDPFMRFHMK